MSWPYAGLYKSKEVTRKHPHGWCCRKTYKVKIECVCRDGRGAIIKRLILGLC